MRKKSLAETNPDLAAQIHPDSDIKADEVTAGSDKKPLWVCERGHTWRTAVRNRMYGHKCPYCGNKKVLPGFNDLATVNPKIAAQIHPNSDIKANEVTACSAKKPLWMCERGHTWRAAVANRTNGRKCPYCGNKKVLPGFNDLATTHPELAEQVSPNSKIKATELTASSTKKPLWVCKLGHTWSVPVANRTSGNDCPYCGNKKVLPGFNDLATVNPELAKQVSPNSKIKATDVTAGSKKKLLWRCRKNHEWKATVADRSIRESGCPYCSGRKSLPGFNDLATVNPELAKQVSPNSKIKATDVTAGSQKRLLWICYEGHEWRAKVSNRSVRGLGCPYCSGMKILPGFNDLATVNPELAKQVSPNSKIKATEATVSSGKRLLWMCSSGHEWEAKVLNRSRGKGCPYCSGRMPVLRVNDLATVNPELAKQVSPNSKIKATQVTSFSNRKLLWRCGRGHEWVAAVSSRTLGNNCPYCGNKKVLPGFNDLATTHPELAKQVSPNSKIKATEITERSSRKVLWCCNKGHEWLSVVANRSRGASCPRCSGSLMEENLAKLIKRLLPNSNSTTRNDRKTIKPYELDILIPDLNLAFEFNGTYWHSDKIIKKRHPQFESSKAFDDFKKAECAKQGIELFFVREKTWTENHDKEVKRVEKIVATALKRAAQPRAI